MTTRNKFSSWLIVGVSGLAVLTAILLFQRYSRKQPHANTSPSSAVQLSSEIRSKEIELPSTKTPQQAIQSDSNKSKKIEIESVSTTIDVIDTAPALDKRASDKEDTIQSLVNSLSEEEIEELKGLTWKDFLSDKERDDVNRQIVKYLKEIAVVAPRMIELRTRVGELDTAINSTVSPEEHAMLAKARDEIFDELDSLRRRASELDAFLLDEEVISVGGDLIDTDKIKQTFDELARGKGWRGYESGLE